MYFVSEFACRDLNGRCQLVLWLPVFQEPDLTQKALFFLALEGGCFPPSLGKIRSGHSRKFKLTGLVACIIFYKICKFESSTITDDVIMASLPKTMAKFGPPQNQTNYISFERY